ncbi:pyridoxamine 5'-phosphate oxidase [bacterium]|nr:pyridoxamine 5'-phosphate oxidase [bacterium]
MNLITAFRTALTLGRGVRHGISELTAAPDPLVLFAEWFRAARESAIYLPESMNLSTATSDGAPSARMVLLKGFDASGFVFYTNYESRKAKELAANPRCALTLHWAVLQRQVRIEGTATRMTTAESEAYFRTRPRGSQLGAWASKQSAVLTTREELDVVVKKMERTWDGKEIPLPPFWGGYRVAPSGIEFWQGRADRLHDRLRYDAADGAWTVKRLSP